MILWNIQNSKTIIFRNWERNVWALQYFWQRNLFLRGCRVPSKIRFTAKHLTVLGLFEIALSKRRAEKKNSGVTNEFWTVETP